MNNRIRIIYVEDQKLVRDTISNLLRDEGIDTIGMAENGIELLALLKNTTPDLILLDLQMPGMDGNEVLPLLKKQYPEMKIVVLTSFTEEWLKNDFKNKGVNAFLTKGCELPLLANTIKRVHSSNEYNNFSDTFKSIFTKREIQTIPLLMAGKTSKEIAGQLGISTKTIEAIRNRLFEKTKSKNAAEFSKYCTKEGLDFLGKKEESI